MFDVAVGLQTAPQSSAALFYTTPLVGTNIYPFTVAASVASPYSANSNAVAGGAVYVTLFGNNIAGSPLAPFVVTAAALNTSTSQLSGAIGTITAGVTSIITLTPRDAYGNAIRTPINATLTMTAVTRPVVVIIGGVSVSSATESAVNFPVMLTVSGAYTLTLVAASVSWTDSHAPTVIPSTSVDSVQSFWWISGGTVTAGGVSSGGGLSIFIVAADAFGNRFVTANPVGASFVITVSASDNQISALSALCSSSGSASAATTTVSANGTAIYGALTCVYSTQRAVYAVTAALYDAEEEYSIAVTIQGATIRRYRRSMRPH